MNTSNVSSGAIQAKAARMLGWDMWRFWGAFTIFWGHNLYALTMSNASLAEQMAPKSPLQFLYYPDNSWAVVFSAVPVFVFISGYFALRTPPKSTDWAKAKNTFCKYVLHVLRWAVIALFLFLVVPGLWPGMEPFVGLGVKEIVLQLYNGFVNTSLSANFLKTTINVNYFVVALAWMSLFAPVFKWFLHNGDIKAKRTLILILTLFCMVFQGARSVGSAVLAANPESTLGAFLSLLNPFSTAQFSWDNFWLVYFLWGGLFAVDTQLQERVKSLRWPVVLLAGFVAFVIKCTLWYYYGFALGSYNCGAGMLMAIVYIMIAYKLNFVIREDSPAGRFTKMFTGDFLGVMTLGLMFGTQLMNSSLKPLMSSLASVIWFPSAPFLTTVLWFLFNATYWFALLVIVHFLRKVPVLGKIFDFPNLKVRAPKEKQAV